MCVRVGVCVSVCACVCTREGHVADVNFQSTELRKCYISIYIFICIYIINIFINALSQGCKNQIIPERKKLNNIQNCCEVFKNI